MDEHLYHPKIYKKQLCQDFNAGNCEAYYCPFAHGYSELTGTSDESLMHHQNNLDPVNSTPPHLNVHNQMPLENSGVCL